MRQILPTIFSGCTRSIHWLVLFEEGSKSKSVLLLGNRLFLLLPVPGIMYFNVSQQPNLDLMFIGQCIILIVE